MFDETVEAFAAFHEANPQVYEELRRLALEAVGVGRRKLGIKMLWEVMRWNHLLQTEGDSFKLNNNFHSFYARLLMDQEPELRGVFETRKSRTKQ